MTRLLLVRHGETDWNAARRLQGQQDVGLSPTGRQQVAAIAADVRQYRPDRVVVSPLLRALQSCAALGCAPDTVDKRWQEADLGRWTGLSAADLRARGDGLYAAWRAGDHTPPDGESFAEMTERVQQAVTELAVLGGTTLVVTHGGPVRAAVASLVRLSPSEIVPVSPGSLTVFDLGDRPRLRAYNVTGQPATGDPPD